MVVEELWRRAATASPAPLPGPPPAVEGIREPTGVPLLDELGASKTLQESGIHALKLVAAAVDIVYAGSILLHLHLLLGRCCSPGACNICSHTRSPVVGANCVHPFLNSALIR